MYLFSDQSQDSECAASAQITGYTRVGGKYYKYSQDPEPFAMAQANCSADGGRLAQFDGGVSEYNNVVLFFGGRAALVSLINYFLAR